MASFKPSSSPPPIEIDKFLGLNESVGETEVNLGESVKQVNFRITQNFKPQKRKGHNTFIDFQNVKDVQGMWHGEIANKEVLIFANNGNVYEYDMASTSTNTLIADLILDGSVKLIGTMTDAKTTIFYFDSKLYFMNGVEYKEYDGTTFQEVIPYVPTVAIGTPPAGGGTPQDPLNLLTGKAKQEFFADGVATEYVLSASGLDADTVLCTINGVSKAETTDFTVDRTLGKVTFSVAPADESEVIIEWTKVVTGNADIIKKCRYAMTFGPGNDTAIFLWGNPEHKNRRSWSGTLKANYFPVINYTYIGSDEAAITDIKPQYDRQLIFRNDGKTHYSYPEWNATAKAWDYPVYDLNGSVGNVAFNQVQLIKNNPVSLHNQALWEWTSTAVEDEKNADVISDKIRESLSTLDLSKAITFDLQRQSELWVNVGSMVYIYNYGNGTFYTYDNVSGTCYLDIKQTVYYGSQGTIERFIGEDDNGVAVTAQLILGFADWGAMEMRKNSREIFPGLLPASQTSLTISYRTNRINEFKPCKPIEYRLLDFNNIDFNNYSFLTNRNPQSFRVKVRAKKYTYIQFMFENKELGETCTILSLKIQAETQGVVK